MVKDKMRKVAIVRFTEGYTDYDDYSSNIVASIPVWEEVTEEVYRLLVDAAAFSSRNNIVNQFKVIELLSTDDIVVVNSVKAYLKYVDDQKKKVEADKAERARKAAERRMKKLAKDKKAREELYNELKDEFEK